MGNVIDVIAVQNLRALLCCVLEKDILRYFPLLVGLREQL